MNSDFLTASKYYLIFIAGAILLTLVVASAIYAFLVAVTVGAGIIGLVSVKTRYPLINPNGPVAVTATYAVIWGAAITISLFLGTLFVNETRGVLSSQAQFDSMMRKDAPLFFVQAVSVLYSAARLSRRQHRKPLTLQAQAAFFALASIIFSVSSSFLHTTNVVDAAGTIVRDILITITFPITGPMQLIDNAPAAFNTLSEWALKGHINLYKFSKVVSVVLYVVAIFKFLKGILMGNSHVQEPHGIEPVDTMTTREILWFLASLFAALAMTILIALSLVEELQGRQFVPWIGNPLATTFIVFCALWVALYHSRKRLR